MVRGGEKWREREESEREKRVRGREREGVGERGRRDIQG